MQQLSDCDKLQNDKFLAESILPEHGLKMKDSFSIFHYHTPSVMKRKAMFFEMKLIDKNQCQRNSSDMHKFKFLSQLKGTHVFSSAGTLKLETYLVTFHAIIAQYFSKSYF